MLALLPVLPSAAISIADVPNPQQIDGTWVTDMAGMIDPATEAQINQTISKLEAETGAEMAVVTVLETQSFSSPKSFATELFNTWGIGKEGEDNGVLFLVSKGDRRTEIETGYGVEGLLSDAKVGSILDTQVTPQFKAGNFGQGILSGTQAIASTLKGETPSTPLPATAPAVNPQQPAPPINTTPANNNTQQNAPSVYLPAAASPSWLTKLMWILFLGLIAPVVVVLKQLRQGKIQYALPPLKIKPIGQMQSKKMASPWLYLWTVTWVGDGVKATDPKAEKEISLCDFSGRYKWNERLATRDGWLLAHHRNQHFNLKGVILFGILLTLSFISSVIPLLVTLEILMAWIWLGYEMKLSKQPDGKPSSLGSAILKTAAIGLTFGFVVVISGLITLGWVWMLSPFLLVASLGTSAGLIRIFRLSPAVQKVTCETCDHAMQKLTSTDLLPQVTGPQQAEIEVGSKACEGWHCQTCVPASQYSTFDKSEIRLFFFRRKKKGIKTCRSCHALTLEVTTKVIAYATTRHSGSKRITRHCHACGIHKEKIVKIPRKSSGSSSSSYGSSYSGSSSSSSSSSSGSSGGSFGGGSSGGGGAGSSW